MNEMYNAIYQIFSLIAIFYIEWCPCVYSPTLLILVSSHHISIIFYLYLLTILLCSNVLFTIFNVPLFMYLEKLYYNNALVNHGIAKSLEKKFLSFWYLLCLDMVLFFAFKFSCHLFVSLTVQAVSVIWSDKKWKSHYGRRRESGSI